MPFLKISLVPKSLRGYQKSWLRTDIIAGVTLAAVAIPETMGYTSIAQTPIVTGLYTVIFPTLLFALLGSSRLLVVGRLRDGCDPGRRVGDGQCGRADAELGVVAGVHVLHRAVVWRHAADRTGGQTRIPR